MQASLVSATFRVHRKVIGIAHLDKDGTKKASWKMFEVMVLNFRGSPMMPQKRSPQMTVARVELLGGTATDMQWPQPAAQKLTSKQGMKYPTKATGGRTKQK
mmetsp:Transcript_74950/g.156274  ORF Transcript_74950/g.156274 Transcript_74950/m.156274 type:complete len:102 (+) Transcript_74950:355-660(+)